MTFFSLYSLRCSEIVDNPDKYSASFSQNGQFCLLDFHELAKPSNNGYMGVYKDGFYLSAPPGPYQQDRNISRVLSYHSPGTLNNRNDVFSTTAAPSPAKQSKAHAKEFGEYHTWSSKAMDPMMLEDDPTQEQVEDGAQFLALLQDRLKTSTVTPRKRKSGKAERLAAQAQTLAVERAEKMAEERAERQAEKRAAKLAAKRAKKIKAKRIYLADEDPEEEMIGANGDLDDPEIEMMGEQENSAIASVNNNGFDNMMMMRLLEDEHKELQERAEILEWQHRNPEAFRHFAPLTESPSNDSMASPPWATLETPDSPAFSPPSMLARRKFSSGKSKAKRLDFERVNLNDVPLQRPVHMPSIFEDEAKRTPTKHLNLRRGKKATRITPLVTKVKPIMPVKAPVTRAAARKVATHIMSPDNILEEVVDLTNASDGADQEDSEEEMDMDDMM